MSRDILLSICIPTYNRDTILQGNLQRILEETKDKQLPIELLVSDNCSTDATQQVVGEYKKAGLDLEYIRNDKNIGADRNFIQCCKRGKGKYILVLGDDDYFIPGKLDSLIHYLENGDYGLVHLQIDAKSGKGIQEYENHELFFRQVSYWITFITSNIFNAKYIKEIDFEAYVGTNFVVVPLFMTAAIRHAKNLVVHERIFEDGKVSDSNGGYNLFQVFVVNYLHIWKEYFERGEISHRCYAWIKHDLYKNFLLFYIVKIYILREKLNFDTANGRKILWETYGTHPYFYYDFTVYVSWYELKRILKKIFGIQR